jgi:hypothetical protein
MRLYRPILLCILELGLAFSTSAQSGRISGTVEKAIRESQQKDKPPREKPEHGEGSGPVIAGERVGGGGNEPPAKPPAESKPKAEPKAEPSRSPESSKPASSDRPVETSKSSSEGTGGNDRPRAGENRPDHSNAKGSSPSQGSSGSAPAPKTATPPSDGGGSDAVATNLEERVVAVKQALDAVRKVKSTPRPRIQVPRKEEIQNDEVQETIETALDLLKGYKEAATVLEAAVKVLSPSSTGTSQDLVWVDAPYPEEIELARAVKELEDARNNQPPDKAAAKRVQDAIDALRRQRTGEIKPPPASNEPKL